MGDLLVAVGDTVSHNQPVATIRQTEALQRLAHARKTAERERELASRRDS